MPRYNNNWNYRNNTRTSTPDPLADIIGFKGSDLTSEERSVKNIRQTAARSMLADGTSIEDITAILGMSADIVIESKSRKNEAAAAGLTSLIRSSNARSINAAIEALKAPAPQELHLVAFDAEVDAVLTYKASDEATEYTVFGRHGYVNPKTGRPSMPSTGQVCRIFVGVGDDPQSKANQKGPSGSQTRHQDWRMQVASEGIGETAMALTTFRIVGVNHVLATSGSRTESELVFYVEAYSMWNDGLSKLMVPFPSMGGEVKGEEGTEFEDGSDTVLPAEFNDEDPLG